MLENQRNIRLLYNLDEPEAMRQFDIRERHGLFIRNADGSLHFPDLSDPNIATLDRAYVRLFNPDNEYRPEAPKFEDDPDLGDVQ